MPTLNTRIQAKFDTEQNFNTQNPVLLDREIVYVQTDDGIKLKKGDGTSHFSELDYLDIAGTDAETLLNTHNTSPNAHENMGWITTEETDLGDIEDFGIDADSLGGIAANQYAKLSDLTGYATTTQLSNYATVASLSDYVKTADFNSVIGDIDSLLD